MNRSVVCIGALAVALFAVPASASTISIFDSGTPNLVDPCTGSGCPTISGNTQTLAEFSAVNSATLDNVVFWTFESDATSWSGTIGWSLYADAGPIPGSAIASQGSVSATKTFVGTAFGNQIYRYDAAVGGPLLTAGTQYWFGPTINGQSHAFWLTSLATDPVERMIQFAGTSTFGPADNRLAFELNGETAAAVPEPASLMLLLTGSAGLLARGRRRRSKRPE